MFPQLTWTAHLQGAKRAFFNIPEETKEEWTTMFMLMR